MGYARMFFSTRHVADWLGISPRTLEGYRITGSGPAFHRFGCTVRYFGADIDIWVAAQRRISTTDKGEALRVAVRWQRRKPPVVGQTRPTRFYRIIRSRLRLDWSHYFVVADHRRPAVATAVG